MKVSRALAFAALAMNGCVADYAKQNSSTMHLEIARIVGISASLDEGDVLYSDVGDGFNDDARLTVNIFRKNPTVEATSAVEHVTMDRYEVRFFRSDGRNTEGVDVPYRISGPMSSFRLHTPTGTGEIEGDVVITVVRQQAKFEPPLRNLVGGFVGIPSQRPQFSGAGILTTIAEITVYARQLDGQTLRASGQLQVTFADFVDE
jgi:hypothetical protein